MFRIACSLALAGSLLAAGTGAAVGADSTQTSFDHTSHMFMGVKANTGSVKHTVVDGSDVLKLSADFKKPDAPAPHWQIVDSAGRTFLLQRLEIKDGKMNRSITVPSHVRDIAKVQIWCAWAETLLGEAEFESVIPVGGARMHTSSGFAGVKANTGFVTHAHQVGTCTLTMSNDFLVPDSPAPHWQVVDSAGRSYLLQRLDIKDGKMNRSITVPSYVPDIAKVQIWCAWAEVLLGEATFESPVS